MIMQNGHNIPLAGPAVRLSQHPGSIPDAAPLTIFMSQCDPTQMAGRFPQRGKISFGRRYYFAAGNRL